MRHQPGYIFGGNTGISYEQLQRKRDIADALMEPGAATTTAGGIGLIGQALIGKYLDKKVSAKEGEARSRAGETARDLVALLSGNSTASAFEPYGQRDKTPSPGLAGIGDMLDRVDPRYTVPPALTAAVMQQESGGDKYALSPEGAAGTMQVMPGTLTNPGYDVRPADDPTNPADQARVGRDYLQAMYQRYKGDVKRTLAAYNWGPGKADNWNGRMDSLPAETRNYITAIMGGSQDGNMDQDAMAKIMQLLNNPYASDAETSVAQALLGQMLQKPEGLTLYQQAQQANKDREAEMRAAGTWAPGTTINVKGIAPTPATGYRNVFDDDGNFIGQEVILGGPADTTEVDARAQEGKARSGGIVVEDIARALEIVAESPNWSTGLGSFLKHIPGTQAKSLSGLLETIAANVGFDRLQRMRDASKTGGALGAINKTEMDLLMASLGNLNQSLSAEDLAFNLRRINGLYMDIIHGKGNWGDSGYELPPETATNTDMTVEKAIRIAEDGVAGNGSAPPTSIYDSFETFSADPGVIAAAKRANVTVEAMWEQYLEANPR